MANDPLVKQRFTQLNLHAAGGSPAQAQAFIRKETQVWGEVIKEAHVPAH